jgi:hypothetical protein
LVNADYFASHQMVFLAWCFCTPTGGALGVTDSGKLRGQSVSGSFHWDFFDVVVSMVCVDCQGLLSIRISPVVVNLRAITLGFLHFIGVSMTSSGTKTRTKTPTSRIDSPNSFERTNFAQSTLDFI